MGPILSMRVALAAATPAAGDGRVAHAGMAGAAVFAAVVLGAFAAAAFLRRRRTPPPLDRVLRAGAVKRARDP
jgi:uncharacterized membrane protein YedE/YeeE